MDNDKNVGFEDQSDTESREHDSGAESSPRARNRTVMLTPEITGQVRARLAQEGAERPAASESNTGGFVPVAPRPAAPSREVAPEPRRNSLNLGQQAPRSVTPPVAQAPMSDTIVWAKSAMLVGFLVTFDNDQNGEYYVLRVGRLIVTSEAPSGGNYLYLKDESVSPMHAIVRIGESGDLQVLDQLSECGSGVRRHETGEETELSGEKCTLGHGDTIRFGRRSFQVCLMPQQVV